VVQLLAFILLISLMAICLLGLLLMLFIYISISKAFRQL
jgi:hypothetical protein